MTGSLSTALSSRLSRSTTGLGIFAGPRIATHELASKSGTPASMKVGTSGSDGARLALETAIGPRAAGLKWEIEPATAVYTSGMLPPRQRSSTAAPCRDVLRLRRARRSSSHAMCGVPPTQRSVERTTAVFRVRDKLLKGLRGDDGYHGAKMRAWRRRSADRRELARKVEGEVREHVRVDHSVRRSEHQRVAVRAAALTQPGMPMLPEAPALFDNACGEAAWKRPRR